MVETLISQARVVADEALKRSRAYKQWQSEREAENLREINRALLTTFDIDLLTDVWSSACPFSGFPAFIL